MTNSGGGRRGRKKRGQNEGEKEKNAQSDWAAPSLGVKQAQLQGNTREVTTFKVAFSMDRGLLDMPGANRARWQDRRRLAGEALVAAHAPSQLMAALDDVMNPGKEGQAWVDHSSTPARLPWPP